MERLRFNLLEIHHYEYRNHLILLLLDIFGVGNHVICIFLSHRKTHSLALLKSALHQHIQFAKTILIFAIESYFFFYNSAIPQS